ncbi:molecular chaperone DnaK [Vigna unguiculata]|uniref:Molecular chaperone DnaK n=1 Tax=Vigna unguiculata TaxID=3917 RepID=A0A4D6L6S9_VIGUN|nr:molecular chaperone DnaK [Vigna unguiculata]
MAAATALLRSLRRRDFPTSSISAFRSLTSGTKTSYVGHKWASLYRPFSSKPAGNDVIGIDLGTTNSCVAVMEGKNPKVIENSEGARTTPSVVAFNQKGELLVGTPAKRQAVKATNGDTFLGGEDFDNALLDFLVNEFKKSESIDLSKDRLALQRLREAAEKAKIELSSTSQTEINLPFITADASGAKHLNITLTRSKFEALVNHLIERTKAPFPLVFSTAADNQTQVGIKVLQGEREMASDNKSLGEFELVGIPPAPRGMPQIEVTFDIDANGIVTVSAKDKSTGKEQQITIRSSGGLSEDDIDKMVKEAELHAQKDQERKALIDIRNSADTTIYSIEKSLGEYREKIPSEVAKEIEDAVSDLRTAMAGENADEIKAKLDAANKAVSKIGQHMSGGSSGGSSSTGGSQGGDQAPEAEYEEVKK